MQENVFHMTYKYLAFKSEFVKINVARAAHFICVHKCYENFRMCAYTCNIHNSTLSIHPHLPPMLKKD
jgi:hypothetical protein